MNCHTVVKTDSPLIQKVRAAYAENRPIEWVRVHELPDYCTSRTSGTSPRAWLARPATGRCRR